MNKRTFRRAIGAACFLSLVFFASQCFAQSSSMSASEAADASIRYSKIITNVLNFVQQNYVDEIDPEVLYEGAMKGMMDALGDPYTVYLDSESLRSLTDTTAGNFGGVGLSITKLITNTPDKQIGRASCRERV